MAVHAHPDDESSKGAATTARYAAEGAEVLVVSCTGGESGSILNPNYRPYITDPTEMAAARALEMAEAAKALGVEHRWLGFIDSGLPEGDPPPPLEPGTFATLPVEQAAIPLLEAIRDFRPHVMTTYDPTGGYPHPDHIMAHKIARWAFDEAADTTVVTPGLPSWSVSKLYYNHDFSLERIRTLHEAIRESGLESPFGDWIDRREVHDIPEREVTTRIRCAEYYPARDAALKAHATQIDPEGFFFAIPRDLEARVWGIEEFELAESRVPVTLPETDLFAGIEAETE